MRPNSIIGQHIAALESVAFQPTTFFKELTAIFAELQNTNKKEVADSPLINQLSKVVKHHTGLEISFELDEYDPCVEIPAVDKNNPLINNFMRGWLSSADGLKMIDNAGGVAHGTVNILTGKVGGVFTDIKHKIHLPLVDFFHHKKFSAEEIAAISLHEIGHLFTYYEFITRSVSTNQVLAGVAKALDGTDSFEQRVAVLTRAQKQLKLKELDAQALAKSRNGKVVETVIVTQVVRESQSELGSNVYDMNSWETLADQYAARLGAGRYVVTGLDKYYRGAWNISFRSTPAFLAFEAYKAMLVIVAFAAAPGTSGVSLYFLLPFMIHAVSDSDPQIYNTPGARFKRVRDQIVTNLKNKKLKPADRARLEADLHAIDQITKEVNDRRQWFGVMWDFISPAARRERSQLLLQQELEALAANELFVKAGQLKQLA